MATVDSGLTTLQDISTTIRRLTNRPSEAQLTSAEINKFVNKFVLYDMPAILNSIPLRKTLTFYLEPYIDTYSNNTTDAEHPLYNFNNKYLSVNGPVYIAGRQAVLYESRELFYNSYPLTNYSTSIGTGDGVTTHFTGTLAYKPALRGSVLFSSVSNNNTGLEAHDNGDEDLLGDVAVAGTIDYVTGLYDFIYVLAPQSGVNIYAQYLAYTPSMPQSVLFYDNKFTVRPVPDQPYALNVEVLERPDYFLDATSEPQYAQWAEFIAYGAAIKILQQSRDQEGAAALMPEFTRQQLLVHRKAIVQQTDSQVVTIYDANVNPMWPLW